MIKILAKLLIVSLLLTESQTWAYDAGSAIQDFSEGFIRGQAAANGTYIPPDTESQPYKRKLEVTRPDGTTTYVTEKYNGKGVTTFTDDRGRTVTVREKRKGGYNGGGEADTGAIIVGGVLVAITIGAILYKILKKSNDSATPEALDKYRVVPPRYSDKELSDMRRSRVAEKLASYGVEAPKTASVADLQDMEARIRWAALIKTECHKDIDWRQHTLVEMQQLGISPCQ